MILGIGAENVVSVPVDKYGKMDHMMFKKLVEKSVHEGKKPFLVVATSGTTVLGAFDPLEKLADVCQEHDMWLHVDAAWGGAVLLSRKYKHLCRGIERADSVTWNPHKMMGVVLQCSALLVKDSDALNTCNKMEANYLFQPDKHYDITYDTGDKTIQCGRRPDAFKLWLAWKAKGEYGFEEHINHCMQLNKYLVSKIKSHPHFEMVFEKPEYVNTCFWYIPPRLKTIYNPKVYKRQLDLVAPRIKQKMMERGNLMVGYQPLDDNVNFFRNILSNGATRQEDIDFMIQEIEICGEDL